jgi:hypothetical protein
VILAANWNAKSADDQQSVSKLSKRIFKEDPFGFLLRIQSTIKSGVELANALWARIHPMKVYSGL